MSAHRTTRRAMLNVVAALSLTAVGTGAALAAHAPSETTFPDLVDELLRLRELMEARVDGWRALSEEADKRFFEETGVTVKQFREVSPWSTEDRDDLRVASLGEDLMDQDKEDEHMSVSASTRYLAAVTSSSISQTMLNGSGNLKLTSSEPRRFALAVMTALRRQRAHGSAPQASPSSRPR